MPHSPVNSDECYMAECLALAEKGAGRVSPNPMVGAVIVRDGRVLGRGYHKRFGEAHAEVNAIHAAKSSVRGGTLYVNLEPCTIYGKTPPCSDLIISSGISRVVVGTGDQNPLVAGKGIRQLRRAGISVTEGVLQDECKRLNEFFFKFIATHKPFVTLKIAQTLDGKIADSRGNAKWITNVLSRGVVHRLRSRYDAVLVGAETVKKDNPRLTVRRVRGRNPLRVVLDDNLNVDPRANVFSDDGRTMLFTDSQTVNRHSQLKRALLKKGVEIVELRKIRKGTFSISGILKELGNRGIASVLVEGGAFTFSEFLNQQQADKVLFFVAPKALGKGTDVFGNLKLKTLGKEVRLNVISAGILGGDIVIEAYVNKR